MSTITQQGYLTLQEELETLQLKTRPGIIEKVQRARSMGDLSENNAYHAAREELAFIEGRILELQSILKSAQVVTQNPASVAGQTGLGARITLESLADASELSFTLVGEFEASPSERKISNKSPLGQAVEGKKQGEVITVTTPSGTVSYKIIDIL